MLNYPCAVSSFLFLLTGIVVKQRLMRITMVLLWLTSVIYHSHRENDTCYYLDQLMVYTTLFVSMHYGKDK